MLDWLRQWRRLRVIQRGWLAHAETDPACKFYRAPRLGSRLDRASRGWSCPICVRLSSDAGDNS